MVPASRFFSLCFFVVLVIIFAGCLGGSNNDSAPVIPTEYVTLSGTLTAPGQLESSLLGNVLQNTDSQVRGAYQKALVYVNGIQNTVFSLTPLSSNPVWQFRIPSVPKSTDGTYRVEVIVGKINLKSLVKADQMGNFSINPHTTAALMLADATGKNTAELMASFPSFISAVENTYLDLCKLEAAKHSGVVVQSATLTQFIQEQKQFFTELGAIQTTGKLAYLKESNDLDGDGVEDVKVSTNTDNSRVIFSTVLSKKTSILEEIDSIAAYSNERLIQDFREDLVSETRFFAANAARFALGMYFKKAAAADVYLKMFVRRIDLTEGVFKGVVVEYEFINAETTAIASGSKTLLRVGASPVDGAIAATNFLTDSEPGPYVIAYISESQGLGSAGDTPIVREKDGKPELANISYADQYLDGGGNYYINTTAALTAAFKSRTIEVGDVFTAYFPNTKNYAVFKIKSIDADKVTVDYIVNAAENEPRFR